MNKLSKITIFSAMVLMMGTVLTGSVFAANYGSPVSSPVTKVDDILIILNNIVKIMYRAFFIVAIGFVILAAFNYLTGSDDPEKIKSATKRIMYAAIAIAVALISVGANKIIDNFIR